MKMMLFLNKSYVNLLFEGVGAADVWKVLLFASLLMIVILLIVIRNMKARSLKIQILYDATKRELGSIQKEIKLLRQKLENQNGMLSIYETNGNEDKWKKKIVYGIQGGFDIPRRC